MSNTRNIVLSICIPTYNRLEELTRCLDSIDCLENDCIEVVVSDNNSKNQTLVQETLEKYYKRFKHFRLNCNKDNIGYDGNIHTLVNLSEGKYILFIADDDVFIPRAIEKLFELIVKHNSASYFTPFF